MAKANVAKKGTNGHTSHGLDAKRRARNVARDAFIAAHAAIYAAEPDLVERLARQIHSISRGTLPDARDAAVRMALFLHVEHGFAPVYLGRLRTLRMR